MVHWRSQKFVDWSMSSSHLSSSNPFKSSGKSISAASCSLKHLSNLNYKHDTIIRIFLTHNAAIWDAEHQMLFHASKYFHRNIWFHASLCNGFSRYVFMIIMWILYCKIINDVFTLIDKTCVSLLMIFFCTKTWHNIDDSIVMTCLTILSNNAQVDFIGQLLKKSKGGFFCTAKVHCHFGFKDFHSGFHMQNSCLVTLDLRYHHVSYHC